MSEPESARERAILDLARFLVAVERPHPLRVAIDGRTAAGKTTLADALVAPIERLGRPAIRIEIDDFHRPRAERRGRRELPPWRRYYLDSYDHPAIRAALLPLGPGGDRRYRSALFDSYHDVPFDEPLRLAPPGAVVLVDGVFLCRPELDDLWDIRIFVEIDVGDTLRRGPIRDLAWRGGTVEEAARSYHTTYIPGEDHYLAVVRPADRADVVVDNRDPAAPQLRFRAEQGARS